MNQSNIFSNRVPSVRYQISQKNTSVDKKHVRNSNHNSSNSFDWNIPTVSFQHQSGHKLVDIHNLKESNSPEQLVSNNRIVVHDQRNQVQRAS